MRVGSLFAGIGGFDLGLERAGMRVVWQSEIDPYASAVLRKHWPTIPNHGDIRNVRAGAVEPVDLICGGFPCQPFSHAGKRVGAQDDRHLWPEMCRVIDELRPAFVIGENVVGIISMELDQVLSDLETIGYAARAIVVPAVAVDAWHRRERVWILACDANRDCESACAVDAEVAGVQSDVADADEQGSQGHRRLRKRAGECVTGPRRWPDEGEWLIESGMGRVANGIPKRMDRLRCLGNAVVPQIVEVIGRAIVQQWRAA